MGHKERDILSFWVEILLLTENHKISIGLIPLWYVRRTYIFRKRCPVTINLIKRKPLT